MELNDSIIQLASMGACDQQAIAAVSLCTVEGPQSPFSSLHVVVVRC